MDDVGNLTLVIGNVIGLGRPGDRGNCVEDSAGADPGATRCRALTARHSPTSSMGQSPDIVPDFVDFLILQRPRIAPRVLRLKTCNFRR